MTGIIVTGLSLLFLVALFSHTPSDLAANSYPPNAQPRNWLGGFGAWLAHGVFFLFGGGGYLLPLIGIGFGLSRLVAVLDFFRRHWFPLLLMFLCWSGILTLYDGMFSGFKAALDIPSAGGLLGLLLNKFFGFFGVLGATVLYGLIYVYAISRFTDNQLFIWLREQWELHQARKADVFAASETKLAKRSKAAARKARAMVDEPAEAEEPADEECVDETEEEQEADPVPEPTIRDMSFSPSRPPEANEGDSEDSEEESEEAEETEISDEEVFEDEETASGEKGPATVDEILGKDGSEDEAPVESDEDIAAFNAAQRAIKRKAKSDPAGKPIQVAAVPEIGEYRLPPIDHLHYHDPNLRPTDSRDELMKNAKLMQTTLAQFGIEVNLGDITKGPTITQYELHPAPGIKLERIANLSNNLAAALKAERINILAPVPGKSSVGIEVPNKVKSMVIMRDLMESPEWIKAKAKAKIPVALGKDVYGHPIIADLAEMPHLLIAGATGAGKSVCINSIIASLLFRFRPDELRFVMIDPKVVELQLYNSLPHLVVPVVTDPKKVVLALRWVVNEMEKRYQIFAKVGVRNIHSFNSRQREEDVQHEEPEPELPLTATKEHVEAGADGFAVEVDEEIVVPRDDDIIVPDKLSYVVVVIDELADLMLVAPADVEMAIARITQMARAAGIHCIVATQRPSVDVITGVIKANIPARIAFQVASKIDSRTILDAMGADKLLGKGDMLYLPPGSAKLIRVQGVLITDEEIQSMVNDITDQEQPSYELEIHQQLQKPVSKYESGGACDEDEELIEQCIEVIRTEQKASVSLMQRRLRLGYTRAARIMDELENRGIVGPSRGAEPREILIDLDAEDAGF